jgi:hypothetical protein
MLEKHRSINNRDYLAKKELMFSNHNSLTQSNHTRSSSRSRFEVSVRSIFVSMHCFCKLLTIYFVNTRTFTVIL